jgi:Flp pilus assembly pilin Flp
MTALRNFWNDDQDQDLIEYNLLMASVALVSAVLLLTAAGGISGIWSVPNTLLTAANSVTW